MKIKNETKDKLVVLFFMFAVLIAMGFFAWVMVGAKDVEASILTEREQINKMFVESQIQRDIEYNKVWKCIENMNEEEYYETFLK